MSVQNAKNYKLVWLIFLYLVHSKFSFESTTLTFENVLSFNLLYLDSCMHKH